MNINFIIADVDGTLVKDDRSMTEYTKDVIRKFRRNSIKFGIASGRDYRQLQGNAEKWDLEPFDMIIGMNGGQVYDRDTDTMHEYYLLAEETIKKIILMMEPLHLNPSMYMPDGVSFCRVVDEGTKESIKRNHKPVHVVKDLSEFWAHPTHKVMFRTTEEQMPTVEAWANAHPSEKYRAFRTQTTMLEFMDPRVNKGMALTEYCKQYNVDIEHTIAFGDMTNDNELLKCAGLGICLLNGDNETKTCADKITDYTNNEDGFARYLVDHNMI